MEELVQLLKTGISERLYQIILSNPRSKEGAAKIKIRPVMVKNQVVYQETDYIGTKVFHENYEKEQMEERICHMLTENFKQCELESMDLKAHILVSKKGKMTIKQQKLQATAKEERPSLSHNRVKTYLLEEGKMVPFLVDLGVQSTDGQILHAKYDKFKQINRFLEFIQDVLPELPSDRELHVIDFGCGKSYLTFAMYYYLTQIAGRTVRITGLDLKEDVIDHCNRLSAKYGYTGLHFLKGDISTFTGADQVDMVVTLHACDTATDYALEKAVKWGAGVILSVPCCQHEVNKQIENAALEPILKYGLIKERMSALLTDAIRANLLEEQGYRTQILEFIDMEHTPKNILIRAVRKNKVENISQRLENTSGNGDDDVQKLKSLTDALSIETTLQKLLQK